MLSSLGSSAANRTVCEPEYGVFRNGHANGRKIHLKHSITIKEMRIKNII